jgi:hypothetical protein
MKLAITLTFVILRLRSNLSLHDWIPDFVVISMMALEVSIAIEDRPALGHHP